MSEIIAVKTTDRMKPIIVLTVGEVTTEDIRELRDNGICVIEAKDPSSVRFIEPPPNGYSVQEYAAIQLCRALLARTNQTSKDRRDIAVLFAEFLTTGGPLSQVQSAATVPTTSPA